MDDNALVSAAAAARANAYAPYSRFPVGAALLARSGSVYRGVNVENASYGVTVCAERAALFAAVTAGELEFDAIAIVADTDGPVRPCGLCRQALSEFGGALRVIMSDLAGRVDVQTLDVLLPDSFRFKSPG
ncbi:MAG: cytidine deaminase [bacterium]